MLMFMFLRFYNLYHKSFHAISITDVQINSAFYVIMYRIVHAKKVCINIWKFVYEVTCFI